MAEQTSSAATAAPADPFSSAKTNLRDTTKWLATTFAALAAVVLAGTSLTGVSQLKGASLVCALGGGAFGLLCVILAAGVMLRLLSSESFFVSQLKDAEHRDLLAFLNQHAVDILPAGMTSVDRFLDLRTEALQQFRDSLGNPESSEFKDADRYLRDIVPSLSRLTNLAQFEVMRRKLKAAEPWLFLFAIGALLGLGVFAVFAGSAKDTKSKAEGDAHAVVLVPGANWSNVGKGFTSVCGDKPPLKAQLLAAPQPGWVKVRLLAPETCAGMEISMPSEVIVQPVRSAP